MNWISVKDRLPEIKKKILLLTDEGVIEGSLNGIGKGWNFLWLKAHGCGCCGEDNPEVTHWMPLPESPKN